MDKQVMQARRESGLARFERTTKGWKIPGTRAAGQHANLTAHTNRILRRIRGDKRFAFYGLGDKPSTKEVLEAVDTASLVEIKAMLSGAK